MDELIGKAVRILRGGGVVAIPTETVYGLAADATNAEAVRRIFQIKGRPATNPLIVHVVDADVARRFARSWPAAAGKLAERFWPGPITLVAPKSAAIVLEATAGLDTVGLRAPDHPLTLELLRAFDGAVAAPSANRSNRVSPTTADDVRQELGDAVDLVLDGGPCRVGIESTVLDLTRNPPAILRPGAITRQQIEAVIGPVEAEHSSVAPEQAARSPGQQAVHYAPRTPAYRYEPPDAARVVEWCSRYPNRRAALLAIHVDPVAAGLSEARVLVPMPPAPDEYARQLYSQLRRADAMGLAAMFIELPPATAPWAAVRDRLRRATREISDAIRS